MFKHTQLSLSFALILGISLFSGQVSARPGGDMFSHLEFIADQVGLSEEQETQINELVHAHELATAVDRERVEQIREQLHTLVEEFDASQAQILADELGEITSRLAYSGAETRAAVQQLFTPEQVAMMEELRKERQAMRAGFSRGFGGRPPRSGSFGEPTGE